MDLTAVIEAQWRIYTAVALALCGLVLLASGLWFGCQGSQGLLRERDVLEWMRGLRLAVVGLCLFGIAVAWVWHVLWLFVAAVGIMGAPQKEW